MNPANYSFFTQFVEIVKSEGFGSLYKGVSSSVLCSIAQNGCHFCFLKIIQHALKLDNTKILHIILSNFLSAMVTVLVTNPIEVLNSRVATSEDEDEGNFSMILKLLKNEGVGGFYNGIYPSLFLTLYPVIQFTIYEKLKGSIKEVTSSDIVLISFISKILTTVINYPMLTIKSILQCNTSNSLGEEKSIFALGSEIYKQQGFTGFYKGMLNKIVASQFNSIALMLIYEKLQEYIRFAVFSILFGIKLKFKAK